MQIIKRVDLCLKLFNEYFLAVEKLKKQIIIKYEVVILKELLKSLVLLLKI